YIPTTDEVRDKYIGQGFVDGEFKDYTAFAREQIGAEFDAWLENVKRDVRREVVDTLAKAGIILPGARDEYMACPADCSLVHGHVARMGDDPYYWSSK